MKRFWRRIVSLYYRTLGRIRQRVLSAGDGPTYLELGPPWKDGFKVLSSSRRYQEVQRRYLRTGAEMGDAVSYLYLGECIGFGDLLDAWEEAEREYVRAGFRALPIEVLTKLGGYGVQPDDVGLLRAPGEPSILHASIYRKNFYLKPVPMELERHANGVISGNWLPPRTSDLCDDDRNR